MKERFALIIGNSNYSFCNQLSNPINDANSMENSIIALGFETRKRLDINLPNFNKEVDEFGLITANYSVSMFYYAGHGLQYNNANYLIPIDADIKDELQIEAYSVSLNRVISYIEKYSKGVNILILDACRNNPFQSTKLRSYPSRGLAFVSAPEGMLIAYSTAPGKTADDGNNRNGLYTEALISQISSPNISLIEVLQRVRYIVKEKSHGDQIPWESTSLTENIYLNGFIKNIVNPELLDIAHFCGSINAKIVFFESTSSDIFDESTEGGELTYYFTGDNIHKISARHFGETGQRITEYYFRTSELCFINICHIQYNRPFYYIEADAKEFGDSEWHDFAKSSFSSLRYYFSSGNFIGGFNDKNEMLQLTDKDVGGYKEQVTKYIAIFYQNKSK